MKKNLAILIGDISRSAGTERAVTNLSNMLVKYGEYNVTILSCFSSENNNPYYELEDKVNIVHYNFSKDSLVNRFSSYINIIGKTNKIIKEKSIDILLGTTHAFNCLMICMSRKVKKVACEHMSYEACPLISKKIRKFCYPRLSAIVLLTNADAKHYKFIEQSKLFVIPNSLSFIADEPAKLENKRIIAVGRLTEQKGFDILMSIAQIIKDEIPDWHIDIFGDGEDKSKLLELISEKKLESFVTINPPTKNIKEELLSSSLFVMTSRWEGLTMILLEAKACGLPIVSFDCPEGPADVIRDCEDGFLIECGDISALSEKIILLGKNQELRKQFGMMAKQSSNKYTASSIFIKWNDLFNSL